jgi:hypothetical protein
MQKEVTKMFRKWLALPALALVIATLACESGRHSAAGFRLPPNGNIENGKAVFVALECYACHEVAGEAMPAPSVKTPLLTIQLGGQVSVEVTDGYLVSSIIHPSYTLARYAKQAITLDGQSRMPNYRDHMTVQQLTDLVAFLQSRYEVQRPIGRYSYD